MRILKKNKKKKNKLVKNFMKLLNMDSMKKKSKALCLKKKLNHNMRI